MKIHTCKQGSTEWHSLRCGKVTASEVDALVTPEFEVRKGDRGQTYLYEKLAEKVFGFQDTSGGTWEMNQGVIIETIAIPWYEFTHDVKIKQVGLCESDDGRFACSPDGLIGEDCGIEIKSPQPPNHLKYLLSGEVPKQYRAQVQFSMFVTGRPKWVFVSFNKSLPALVLTVQRDPEAQAAIAEALAGFQAKFDAALKTINALMARPAQ